MSQNTDTGSPDIFNLELQLQEKINELQWKSEALKKSQKELLEFQQQLLNKDVILEDRKRVINDLKMQLKTAHQVIEWLEKEKAKSANEKIQLQINCDEALKERESLLTQAHAAKLENVMLKVNVQKLTENISAHESIKKSMETSLLEMQERISQTTKSLESNVTKLEKEQQLLLKSVESTSQLNKRLQTVGLCTYAIYTKKNQEITELQKQLILNTHSNVPSPQVQAIHTSNTTCKRRFNAKAVLEQMCLDTEKDIEADKEIEAFLAE